MSTPPDGFAKCTVEPPSEVDGLRADNKRLRANATAREGVMRREGDLLRKAQARLAARGPVTFLEAEYLDARRAATEQRGRADRAEAADRARVQELTDAANEIAQLRADLEAAKAEAIIGPEEFQEMVEHEKALARAVVAAKADERAAIVAWLRHQSFAVWERRIGLTWMDTSFEAIERGDHRKDEP